jgi:hypothetical protein
LWKKFDEFILKPLFIYKYEIRKEKIEIEKKNLKLNSSFFDAGNFLKDNLK